MPEVWNSLGTIGRFEANRKVVDPALSAILQGIVERHLPHGTILEIGSGTGALRKRISPQDKDRNLVHIDSSEVYAAKMHSNFPHAAILASEAARLPFGDSVLDGVISLSSFDTFANLGTAVQETQRVLREGNKFVHILDLVPDPVLLIEYLLQSGEIPFPNSAIGDFPELAWRVATESQISSFLAEKNAPRDLRFELASYVQNITYNLGLVNTEAGKKLARKLDTVGFPGEVTSLSSLFATRLINEMKAVGFRDMIEESYIAQYEMPRSDAFNELTQHDPYLNTISMAVGSRFVSYHPDVAEGNVLTTSIVQCVSGIK